MILGSFSGMRKYLEKEMLTESLKGRIRYHCTRYVGMDDCHIFSIYVDGNMIKQFSWETVNSYFIRELYAKDDTQQERCSALPHYWRGFFSSLEQYPMEQRREHTDEEFCEALTLYRNQPIKESVSSNNPLVRMFALLDRRVGKRTLERVKNTVEEQPEWLQFFYRLRIESEGICL